MTKCDFCVYQTTCISAAGNTNYRPDSYVGSEECREALKSFTEYVMLKERNKSKTKTYNKNINYKKR